MKSYIKTRTLISIQEVQRKEKVERYGDVHLAWDSDVDSVGGDEHNQHRKNPPSQQIIHSLEILLPSSPATFASASGFVFISVLIPLLQVRKVYVPSRLTVIGNPQCPVSREKTVRIRRSATVIV